MILLFFEDPYAAVVGRSRIRANKLSKHVLARAKDKVPTKTGFACRFQLP
ncbi:hypothetical protein ACMZ4X_03271 [Achromobacter marplatensis]